MKRLMLIDHLAGELYLLEWRSGLFQKSWFATPVLDLEPEELDGYRLRETPDLEGLWHFDPWWLLAEEPFAGLEVTPSLKQTNCVAHAPKLCALNFSRNLFSVSSVMVSNENGEAQFTNLRALELPAAEACLPSADGKRGRRGWVLRPFWGASSRRGSLSRKQKALT